MLENKDVHKTKYCCSILCPLTSLKQICGILLLTPLVVEVHQGDGCFYRVSNLIVDQV